MDKKWDSPIDTLYQVAVKVNSEDEIRDVVKKWYDIGKKQKVVISKKLQILLNS